MTQKGRNKSKKEKDRDVKQVSFSLTDKFEDDLLQFALEQGIFSKYVKRLIFLHKSGMINFPAELTKSEISKIPTGFTEEKERAKPTGLSEEEENMLSIL